ncbi:MAG: AI-2E family transporter [Spirochaetes bacterium]|nr:AI-2E family transporter [Spirochaetota bacterium]
MSEEINQLNKYLKYILLMLIFFLLIIFLYFTHLMAGFLVPLFVALFTAFLLQPSIDKLSKAGVPNWLAIIIITALFLLVISFLLTILILSLQNFANDLPELSEEFRVKSLELFKRLSNLEIIQNYIDRERFLDLVFNIAAKINFGSYMLVTMTKTLELLKNFGLYILGLIFILPGISRIQWRIAKAFPKNERKIFVIFTNITRQIQNYIVVKSLVSLLIGFLSYLVCVIFKVKYAPLWGFITFLFNYIPYIGSIVAVQLPAALSLMQYQSALHTISLLILLTLFQNIVGNLIEPKFYSHGVNLTPIVIFTSLLIWGYIWGIAGVFLAVPVTSAINLICENISTLKPVSTLISVRRKKRKKKLKKPL